MSFLFGSHDKGDNKDRFLYKCPNCGDSSRLKESMHTFAISEGDPDNDFCEFVVKCWRCRTYFKTRWFLDAKEPIEIREPKYGQ